LLLVGQVLLQLVRLILVVCLLSADVKAAAHQRVGVNIVHDIAIDPLHELMGRQPVQHDLSIGRIRRPHDESRGGEIVLALGHYLLLSLARGQQSGSHQQTHHRAESEFTNCHKESPEESVKYFADLNALSLHMPQTLSNARSASNAVFSPGIAGGHMKLSSLILLGLLGVVGPALFASPARADNFGRIRYDRQTDRLIVTMIYRGTNPNHKFSLKWGECQSDQSGTLPGVTVEVLDDQFDDVAQQDYKKTMHFSLAELPCPRPVAVTLKTAPRFFFTLTIPGK
jgi:hypothetical protein